MRAKRFELLHLSISRPKRDALTTRPNPLLLKCFVETFVRSTHAEMLVPPLKGWTRLRLCSYDLPSKSHMLASSPSSFTSISTAEIVSVFTKYNSNLFTNETNKHQQQQQQQQ
ncbi:unnamed protein product [Ambrosiozyma monospora]|uniref:Unnamed protein product n=1 Tax=Ambrosiozyma monospora TaxID=43982 RepID=A0A9W7DGC6_AMBMO|nr:unnamed protein product [Ambrosiozyma monospora]